MIYVCVILGFGMLALGIRLATMTRNLQWMLKDQSIVTMTWVASGDDSLLAEQIIQYAYEGGPRPRVPSDHPRATQIASSMVMADKWHAIVLESNKSFWQRVFGL